MSVNKIECSHFFGGKPGPTVRILLYTDDPIRVHDDVIENWSLGVMLQHIGTHAPAFANLCFKLVCRNSRPSIHADQKLDDLIQSGNFDQIWIFGVHQGNRDNHTGVFLDGGPRSELEPDEIEALENWMLIGGERQRGGGILLTGDHGEELPNDAILSGPPPASGLWGIGRALGIKVPRARQMRRWDGPPRSGSQSQNTHVSTSNFDNPALGFDDMPQRLKLTPLENGQPHPLFFYQQGSFIEVFPDHMHEGAIKLPTAAELANEKEWPGSVKPEVVARGTDLSKGGVEVDLVAAYDGDLAGVGRIVSDSTWHHYFNVNLNRFIPPGAINSATDQIGQYYANLAVWLTPLVKRREMARAMIDWLAIPNSPLAELAFANLSREASSEAWSNLGKRSYEALAQVASRCELNELCTLLPELPRNRMSMVQEGFINPRVKLASLIKQFHEAVTYVGNSHPVEAELVTL